MYFVIIVVDRSLAIEKEFRETVEHECPVRESREITLRFSAALRSGGLARTAQEGC